MQMLFDIFPVVLFFITFKFYGIYIATAVIIVAAILQVGISWLKYRRVSLLLLITCGVVIIFGGITLLAKNPIFIKWKPTALAWTLVIVCLGSRLFCKKTFLEYLLAHNVTLPTHAWHRLNLAWIVFFSLVGAVNLYVAYNYNTNVWVNFKVFGVLGATIIFSVLQSIYIAKYLKD